MKRRVVFFEIIVFCMLLTFCGLVMPGKGFSVEQDLHLQISPPLPEDNVDRNIPVGQRAGRWDVAVLIGNKNYQRHGIPEVTYADHDLSILKAYLVRTMGFRADNIIEERDATKGTFETLFGTQNRPQGKLFNYVKKNKSRVFLYYVGHGAPDIKSGEGYFVPVDADPDYIAYSGYALSVFYTNLRLLPAREVVVVLDACFSGRTQDGLIFKNVSPAMLKVKESRSGLENGALLASSRSEEVSSWYPAKRHGLFTYYFLKGLRGDADANKDRIITTGEMSSYLGEEVPYMARRLAGKRQNPKLEGRKDLVLVRLR